MSLFGAIQMGGNTLKAMQIGLHVVGNNIANANTPGYVRQETIYTPGPVQIQGRLILGTGVLVEDIVQKLDRFVQDRLIGARGDRANAEIQEQAFADLEGILNALSEETNLSSSLTSFFNSIHEVMKDPGNLATRDLAISAGEAVAENFAGLQRRAFDLQSRLNERVTAITEEINVLSEEIRSLNQKIASTEGTSGSAAAGLRIERQMAIDRLSELINIRVDEQPGGGVNVGVGGEFLVFDIQRRELAVAPSEDGGTAKGIIEFADTRSTLEVSGGELQGLYLARDEIFEGFLDQLDTIAATLAFEFNKVYSQGQGLVGFNELTSVESINDADAALDEAGLTFTPVSGTFDIVITNKTNPLLTNTHTVQIDLHGLDEDTTLASLAEQLDALDGLSASISTSGQLQLSADSDDVEFSFAGDTSGVLAALGLNTFFTGSTASSLGVNQELEGIENAAKFAASQGGIGNDARNAELLAAFMDEPLESAGNASLTDLYNQLMNGVTQGSGVAKAVADGSRIFEGALEGQHQAVSGVSIDEEAVKMIILQRIYQASARYIQTVSELLDLLVNL
jgi:flagellar hook-associated protein 1 FlgK